MRGGFAIVFLMAHIAFGIKWHYQPGADLRNSLQRIERAEGDTAYVLIDTLSARSGLFAYEVRDSTISPEIRYRYRVVNTRAGKRAEGKSRTGLILEWSGQLDEWRDYSFYTADADSQLLTVYLPSAPYRGGDAWLITWTPGPPVETVEACCLFDFNEDGRVALGDLVIFGSRPHNLSDFVSFGRMYQRLSHLRFSRRIE